MAKKKEIESLNETSLATLSIEELEARLKLEHVESRGELWTGCGCESECAPEFGPCRDFGMPNCDMKDCVPFVCWRGTF